MTGFTEPEFLSCFSFITEDQGCSMIFHDQGFLEIQGTPAKLEACSQVIESVLGYYFFNEDIPETLCGWPVKRQG